MRTNSWIAPCFLITALAAGCAEGHGEPPVADVEGQRYALIGEGGDRSIFIIGTQPPAEDLERVLADEVTESWWIKVEVPHVARDGSEVPLGSETTFDLADPAVPVVYSDSYRSVCDDPDDLSEEVADRCWIVLRHEAGDDGLEGYITVHRTSDKLRVTYEVDWVGTYGDLGDQLDMFPPEATFGRVTGGIEVVASEHIVEARL